MATIDMQKIDELLKDDEDYNYFVKYWRGRGKFTVDITNGIKLWGIEWDGVDIANAGAVEQFIAYYVDQESDSTITLKEKAIVNNLKFFYFMMCIMDQLSDNLWRYNRYDEPGLSINLDRTYSGGAIKIKVSRTFPGQIEYYLNLDVNGIGVIFSLIDNNVCLEHYLYDDDPIVLKLITPVNHDQVELKITPEQLTKDLIVNAIKDVIA